MIAEHQHKLQQQQQQQSAINGVGKPGQPEKDAENFNEAAYNQQQMEAQALLQEQEQIFNANIAQIDTQMSEQ